MTPSARLAAAASILENLDFTRLVDPQLKRWQREHRFAGSGDKRAIADRVYTCLRQMRSAAGYAGGRTGRALVIGSLVSDDGLGVDAIAALCVGGYGLDPLTDEERVVLSAAPVFESEAARVDWPDWLMPQTVRAFGAAAADELDALRARAPLDLRVNTLRCTLEAARASLAEQGMEAEPVAVSSTALRLPPGTPVATSAAFAEGLVEPQDAASQAVVAFTQVEPDQTVLDYCAGAGGKTLALAAQMQNRGYLYAHDIDARRMEELPERAKRCGAKIIERISTEHLKSEMYDVVLVDAPCSGSGSWRRDPLGKWRLTPERLESFEAAQREAVNTAAHFVRGGGTLTYATCSVLPSENDDQVARVLAGRPDLTLEDTLALWPHRDGCDGFYAARFRKRGD